jgi:nitroimidazol reductase NimA-like FMN-containing flavoprotein (pyridoxamine 5'-phosphate oxidase superfamily)
LVKAGVINLDNNGTGEPAESPKVCFTISEIGRLLPAAEALEFSVEYTGVVVFGRGQVINDLTEAKHGLQQILDKYAPHLKPGQDYRPIVEEELKRTAVFRIAIEEWSGKKKEVPPDFPGAFYYGTATPNAS